MSHRDPPDIGTVFRTEYGRVVAFLIGRFGDIDLAEDAVQEAFVVASQQWRTTGIPPNPGGWITTTARNKAIDRLRREGKRDERQTQAQALLEQTGPDQTVSGQSQPGEEVTAVDDDRLRLIFTCCHPSLAPPAQVALTLRLLGGLETSEIARVR